MRVEVIEASAVDGLQQGIVLLEIEQRVELSQGLVAVGCCLTTLVALAVAQGIDVDETRVAVVKLHLCLVAILADEDDLVTTA